jgi:hypothetical protein
VKRERRNRNQAIAKLREAGWRNLLDRVLHAWLHEKVLDAEEFSTLAEARLIVAERRDDYNANYHHSALGTMAPSRFAARPARSFADAAPGARESVVHELKLSPGTSSVRPTT